MMRFLQREIPNGTFYVLFDSVDPGGEHLKRSEIPANLHDALPINYCPNACSKIRSRASKSSGTR
jgi:hypothetical protein